MNHEQQYDTWSEHPIYRVQDWKHEVMNDDTRLGYWEWVEHQREADALP